MLRAGDVLGGRAEAAVGFNVGGGHDDIDGVRVGTSSWACATIHGRGSSYVGIWTSEDFGITMRTFYFLSNYNALYFNHIRHLASWCLLGTEINLI